MTGPVSRETTFKEMAMKGCASNCTGRTIDHVPVKNKQHEGFCGACGHANAEHRKRRV